jgi:hypothetical protein
MTRIRSEKANTIALISLTVGFVIGPLLVLITQMSLHEVDRARVHSILEAASLVAANDMSRIIINDKNFGYVALSNYPPIGKATLADDGEPLPVLGINTLVGTIRQNTIIARELNNTTMEQFVQKDKELSVLTIKALNKALANACQGKGDEKENAYMDIQGAAVEPQADVSKFIESQLPDTMELVSVNLTNGWLSQGGDTTIALPKPERLAQVRSENAIGGHYRAFTAVPAFGEVFTFAGLGKSSTTANSAFFQKADDKHICSIVKIECTVKIKNPNKFLPFGFDSGSEIASTACAQPYAMPDNGPAGALTLRFTSGPVPGLQSWSDFLSGSFMDTKVINYDVTDGDYPVNQSAQMKPHESFLPPGTNQQFAQHLYYWLRNGHTRPDIDAVLSMITDAFKSGANQIYTYEFAQDGQISRRIIAKDPFPIGVTADEQMQTVSDTQIQGGVTPIIIFRDDVAKLGTINGGMHAGQPLAGTPLNWCELTEYGGDPEMAKKLNKGHLGTKLTLVDATGNTLPDSAINDPNFALFQTFEGKSLFHQPRRSFYSGGLALDIEIGGTTSAGNMAAGATDSNGSQLPSILNIPSKAWIFANRKI